MKTAEEILSYYLTSKNWSDTFKYWIFDNEQIDQIKNDIDKVLLEAYKDRDYYKELWLEDLLDNFSQACWIKDIEKYDHMCNSTWEYAQRELIKYGIIKKEDCYRE
jgi:hypothetical protein